MVVAALPWHFSAKLVPLIVGTVALIVIALSLFNEMCRKPTAAGAESLADQAQHEVEQKIHMDLTSDTGHLPVRTIVDAGGALLWLPAGLHGVDGADRTDSHGRWCSSSSSCGSRARNAGRWCIPYVAVLILAIYVAFDLFMSIPWPPTLLGKLVPALKSFRRCSNRLVRRRRPGHLGRGGAPAQHRASLFGFAATIPGSEENCPWTKQPPVSMGSKPDISFTSADWACPPAICGSLENIHAACALRSVFWRARRWPWPSRHRIYASCAFAAPRPSPAAVPTPANADLPPPSVKRHFAGASRRELRGRRSPSRQAAAPASEATSRCRREAGAEHPRSGADGASPTSCANIGRRQIRPHPGRQEGARSHRGVLREPQLRAALDQRRRHQPARQGGGGLPRQHRGRRPRSERLSVAAGQARRRARTRWPKPSSSSPTRCSTYARHAQTGRVHFSRVASDIQYDPVKPEPADVLASSPLRQTRARRSTATIRRNPATRR